MKAKPAQETPNKANGFRKEYFGELVALEASNFWFIARNELIVWALKKYCKDFSSLLEIGCGTGYVMSGITENFRDAELIGSELFEEGIEHARKRLPASKFLQMDAREIPFKSKFNVIGAFDVLEHIQQDEVVLREVSQALKAAGYMILTVPQHKWLWSPTDEYACHERRYSSKELNKKVRAAGFEVVRSTSFVSFLLPAVLWSRIREKNKKIYEIDPMAEFRLPRFLNQMLLVILRFEIKLIKLGINFPFGSSRLLVVRKI